MNLGREIVERSDHTAWSREHAVGEPAGEPEVGQRRAVGSKHHVGRLDVAMDEPGPAARQARCQARRRSGRAAGGTRTVAPSWSAAVYLDEARRDSEVRSPHPSRRLRRGWGWSSCAAIRPRSKRRRKVSSPESSRRSDWSAASPPAPAERERRFRRHPRRAERRGGMGRGCHQAAARALPLSRDPRIETRVGLQVTTA